MTLPCQLECSFMWDCNFMIHACRNNFIRGAQLYKDVASGAQDFEYAEWLRQEAPNLWVRCMQCFEQNNPILPHRFPCQIKPQHMPPLSLRRLLCICVALNSCSPFPGSKRASRCFHPSDCCKLNSKLWNPPFPGYCSNQVEAQWKAAPSSNVGTQMLVLKCWYSNVGIQLLAFCCHHSFQFNPSTSFPMSD